MQTYVVQVVIRRVTSPHTGLGKFRLISFLAPTTFPAGPSKFNLCRSCRGLGPSGWPQQWYTNTAPQRFTRLARNDLADYSEEKNATTTRLLNGFPRSQRKTNPSRTAAVSLGVSARRLHSKSRQQEDASMCTLFALH